MRSPHTTGLEWANPGITVFQMMFVPCLLSQLTGRSVPSATPEAPFPRNEGQFCAAAKAAVASTSTILMSIATIILSLSGSADFNNMDLLIFDLDGTLIDSKLDLAHAVNATRRMMGLPPIDN